MERTHPDVQTLADQAEAFARHWFDARGDGRLVVSVGRPGCGKTHVAKRLWEWARAVAFLRWEKTAKRAQDAIPAVTFAAWGPLASAEQLTEEGFARFIRDVEDSSIVIIDDIGTETDRFRTGIPCARLCQLINRCRGKWLWMTTNRAPGEWAATWDKRVEDRMLAGDVVISDAPSYRSEV